MADTSERRVFCNTILLKYHDLNMDLTAARNSACKISGNGEPETVMNIPLKGCGTKQVKKNSLQYVEGSLVISDYL